MGNSEARRKNKWLFGCARNANTLLKEGVNPGSARFVEKPLLSSKKRKVSLQNPKKSDPLLNGEPLSCALKKVYFHTLGCKVNYADTQGMMVSLAQNGFQVIDELAEADVVVFNTCAVTKEVEKEAGKLWRRFRRVCPDAITVLTGCLANLPDTQSSLWQADVLLGNQEKNRIAEFIQQASLAKEESQQFVIVSPIRKVAELPRLPAGKFPARTRRFLKIQDGCSRFCTFCIVPYVRGRERSMPLEEVLKILDQWEEEEVPEVVLVGIHLAAYGRDQKPKTSLAELVRRICGKKYAFRVRISSLEPQDISDELIETVAEGRRWICPHFHLPLQSGSDNVLKRMRRGYSLEDYRRKLERIRDIVPDVEISTDVIVGFPGEEEKDFECTVQAIKDLDFVRVHSFPYSPRKGTASAEWEQISEEEKKNRQKTVLALLAQLWEKKMKNNLGRKFEVIAESRSSTFPGYFEGYSENYFPVLVPAFRQGERIRGASVGIWKQHLILEKEADDV